MSDEENDVQIREEKAGSNSITPIRVATESFEESADNVQKYAMRYRYDTWRVRVMDAQRSSVSLINPLGKTTAQLTSATLIYQANSYSFTTAHNADRNDGSAKIVTPYSLEVNGHEDAPLRRRSARLFYEGRPIGEIQRLRLYDIMEAVSLWYFERKDSDGAPLPEKVFVNPVLGCALRCKTCSRLGFLNKPLEYEQNIEKITDEIASQVANPDDVKVVNISTGTLPTPAEDFDAFKAIIQCFRRKQFGRARFSIQTSTVFDDSQLRQLVALGVDRFSVTMDGTSDEVLRKLYRGKGVGTIDGYAEMVRKLESRFQKVAVHMILGNDSVATIKKTAERFAKQGRSAIHHYIPRIFQPHQYTMLHSEAITLGLEYYVNLIRFIDDLNDDRMPEMDLLNPFYGLQPSEFQR
jgi:pyruvate-formate lyase-activating enzyme